jgi:hypothetical protein
MNGIADLVAKTKKQQASKKAAGLRTMKPSPGKHTYRILPTWRLNTQPEECKKEAQPFWHDFAMHWVRTEKNGKPTAYICLEKTFGAECPVCSAIGRGISASDDDATVELLKEANASQKYLLNVLHRTSPDKPNEVQVMEVGQKIFDQLIEFMSEYGDITDLKEGMDLIINREGSGMDTRYTVLPAAKHKPVSKDVMAKLLDLDSVVQQENETKLNLALENLGKVSGIMPSRAAPSSSRASLVDMTDVEDGEYAESSASEADQSEDDEVAADDISEDELDDLLGDLEKDGTNG